MLSRTQSDPRELWATDAARPSADAPSASLSSALRRTPGHGPSSRAFTLIELLVVIANKNPWLDAPSGRHGNAGGFTFADSHSEIHKFTPPGLSFVRKSGDGSTPRPYPDLPFIGPSDLRDYHWMTNHLAPLR